MLFYKSTSTHINGKRESANPPKCKKSINYVGDNFKPILSKYKKSIKCFFTVHISMYCRWRVELQGSTEPAASSRAQSTSSSPTFASRKDDIYYRLPKKKYVSMFQSGGEVFCVSERDLTSLRCHFVL